MNIITEQLEKNIGTQTSELKSYLLKNKKGMSVTILNYGAVIASIEVPDRNGKIENVTLGHKSLSDYVGGPYYLGATVGRYANSFYPQRISSLQKTPLFLWNLRLLI